MKKRKDSYHNVARGLVDRISALPEMPLAEEKAAIVEIFKTFGATRTDLADAFWVMDSQPYSVAVSANPWHARLRRVRNDPTYGKQLFAIWA